ncbi:hypothetical protein [Leptotrichia sp. oral taxon 847]|uniref:hypothetical protein n=1 Tax=Leptotrichia sp. oral taxon 847 TaxID=1785996 RepID=UPI0007682B42|nr:hypothetical protein [Leptotrichia sp. oral taxon 847]AMD95423.1 hypothetical protein AXF11_07465 [Leptotrichia sp. oral taxon 847]
MSVSNKGAGDTRQMSSDWIDTLVQKLGQNSSVAKEIKAAQKNGKLKTGLVGVDKTNEKLIFVPVNIENK